MEAIKRINNINSNFVKKDEVKRGDIFWCSLGKDGEGSEQKGNRIGVVVSNNIGNTHAPVVTVVFITSSTTKAKIPTHVELKAIEDRIPKDSVILCEQTRTISKSRLGDRVGSLNEIKTRKMDNALKISMGLN